MIRHYDQESDQLSHPVGGNEGRPATASVHSGKSAALAAGPANAKRDKVEVEQHSDAIERRQGIANRRLRNDKETHAVFASSRRLW